MAIELDGKIHNYQMEYDTVRDSPLNEMGLTALRFKDERVLSHIGEVLEQIRKFVRWQLTPCQLC